MKVRLSVEFDVEVTEPTEGMELTENQIKSAASIAAFDNLCLTMNGQDVCEDVEVHVDGFGTCTVKVGEAHE